MLNIVLLGKPGVGKGTQATVVKKKYNLTHISTGDLFRNNIENGTSLGKLAQVYMDKGDLVPDSVTIDMLKDAVLNAPCSDGFIFDGFPRTVEQAKALDAFLNSNKMELSVTVALEADDDVLVKRLLNRGTTGDRTDDQDEQKIRNRFDEYNAKTTPLKSYYEKQGKLYVVNGVGDIESITKRLMAVIDRFKGT